MKLFPIYILLFISGLLHAQSATIRQLESEAHNASGETKAQKTIQLSEQFTKEGFLKEGVQKAQEGYEIAKRLGNKDLMAMALSREARASFKMGTPLARKRAEKLMRESLDMLKNTTTAIPLKIEILESMLKVAEGRGDKKQADDFANQIAILKGEKPAHVTQQPENSGGLFGRRKRMLEQIQSRQSEMTEKLDSLESVASQSKVNQEQLSQMLKQKEVAIANMTEAQMRQELLLSKQEKLLDSLAYISLLDSLQLAQQTSQLREQEMQIREQKAQSDLQKSQRNLLMAVAGIILLVAGGLWFRYTGIKKHNTVLAEKNQIIESEKQRSEDLLLNILPKEVADELKSKGNADARFYEMVTVLFTDFKNFSNIAENLSPQQLVADLDYCFREFDKIISKYGLEKIKTIGDAYMCAGGLPTPNDSHPKNVIFAALEIQTFLRLWKLEKARLNQPFFEARIGVHSGPIVAGVVGEKKYAYDIWGNTVNVASRLETAGEPGKVNISGATFQLVKDSFACESRGKLPTKNLGDIEMYFVKNGKSV